MVLSVLVSIFKPNRMMYLPLLLLPGNNCLCICLAGEKPDKELGHSRGAWRYCLGHRVLSCMMCVVNVCCVVNFVFALSQLRGVEWGWPGRREPDDEHSPAS